MTKYLLCTLLTCIPMHLAMAESEVPIDNNTAPIDQVEEVETGTREQLVIDTAKSPSLPDVPVLDLGSNLIPHANVAVPWSDAISPSSEGQRSKPTIGDLIPDEAGGIWILGKDDAGRLFIRFCGNSGPDSCSRWMAADIGWHGRLEHPLVP